MSVETEESLIQRAASGNQSEFVAVLNKVPDVAPIADDTL